ncbi:hypothetical protein ACFSO9_14675 [Mesonia maritima]|uniref:hypothetical protein n=1 Tax=Mesonia maritima TaxID=1793873 RepID=UPI0036299B35
MWEEAISAIKKSDESWLKNNHHDFKLFFESENILPLGKLSETALSHHYKHKLFKMFVSEKYNGLALDFLSASKWIENASYLDGNWGWLLAIGVGGAYFIDFLPHEIADHYFSSENALVAGSGKPDGEAIKKDEKYTINGKWSFCSGAEQASLFTATTTKDNQLTAVILPKEQVEIWRDWNMIGLPFTCSHTIIANNIEVTENHFFSLQQVIQENSYSLSKISFLGFAMICFVPVVKGISKCFWNQVEELLIERQSTWQEYQSKRYLFIKGACENLSKHF